MKHIKLLFVFAFALLLFACEATLPQVEQVNNPDAITLKQFDSTDDTLSETLKVELDNGNTQSVTIDWETSLQDYEANENGTYEIEGTLEGDAFKNPDNIKAIQTVIVEPATFKEALDYSERTAHFKAMYEAFDHPDKDSAQTLFVPSDEAVQSILDFLEMDIETLMNQDYFNALMLDHMSAESISKNRLETNVPNVYTTLREKDLVVEGELGSPLIDSEHTLIESLDLDTRHVHIMDGMILSEDTLNMVGSGVFDSEMQERLLGILRDEGFITDILLGNKFTFFIPSQSALLDYAESEGISLNAFLDSSEFESIILSHVVRAEYSVEDLYLEAPLTLESVSGESIEITLEGDDLYANTVLVSESETIDQAGTLLTIESILEFEDE